MRRFQGRRSGYFQFALALLLGFATESCLSFGLRILHPGRIGQVYFLQRPSHYASPAYRGIHQLDLLCSLSRSLRRDGLSAAIPSRNTVRSNPQSTIKRNFAPNTRDTVNVVSLNNKEREKTAMFPMLSGYTGVKPMLDDTMPLLEKGTGAGGIRAVDAVNLMNRLKQMSRDRRSGAADCEEQIHHAMELSAQMATAGMRTMYPKHVALALNAIKDRSPPLFPAKVDSMAGRQRVFSELFAEGIARAEQLLSLQGGRHEPQAAFDANAMSAQTLAIILNAVTSGGQSVLPLFGKASAHLQTLDDTSADAHSIASVLNAFAVLDVWDANLFRCMSARVVKLPRDSFTLQSVGMILNSHSRFLERTCTWDVAESDIMLFRSLSLVTRWLCSQEHLRDAGTVRSLTLIVNAFAKVGVPDAALFADVASLLESGRRSPARNATARASSGLFDSQSVANLMNAYAKSEALTGSLFTLLSDEAKSLPPSTLQGQHIANILNAAVKAGHQDVELFKHMSGPLRKARIARNAESGSLTPQAIALVLNAYARAEVEDSPLFLHMSKLVQEHLQQKQYPLAPQVCGQMQTEGLLLKHIANILNAFVRLEQVNEATFRKLSAISQGLPASKRDAQSIALIANAFAKADFKDPKLFSFLSDSALTLPIGDFNSQSLAVLSNAYAKSGVRDHGLFRRLCLHALALQDEDFDEQSIANIVNAFAKNSLSWARHAGAAPSAWQQLQAMMRKLAKALLRLPASSFTAQGVALIVNAYAKLKREGLVLEPVSTASSSGEDAGFTLLFAHLSAVARQMGSRCFELPCDAQHVANIVNGYAKAGVIDVELFSHLSFVAQGMGRASFDAQNVANIMHAFATVRIRDVALFAWMSRVARSYDPGHFDAQHIANIIHSLAVLGIKDDQLVHHLYANILRSRQTDLFQSDFNAQAMANLAWSAAVLEIQDKIVHRWIAAGCARKLRDMDSNCLCQVHQYLLSCELEHLDGSGDDDQSTSDGMRVLRANRETIRQAFQGRAAKFEGVGTSKDMPVSLLQRDVADTLKAVGIRGVLEEFTDPTTGYSIDLKIPNTNVIIEVDGPTHYSYGSHMTLGHTQVKRRHLAALGYTLYTVPYWRWHHGKSRELKCRRLRAVLWRQRDRGCTPALDQEQQAETNEDKSTSSSSSKLTLSSSASLHKHTSPLPPIWSLLHYFGQHRLLGELRSSELALRNVVGDARKSAHLEKKRSALQRALDNAAHK